MDFNSLVGAKGTAGSIADFLNNSTIAASVPTFIADAEAMLYRRLRHWRMLVPPVAGVMTIGVDQIAVPADMLEPYLFFITSNSTTPGYGPQEISLATPDQVILSYAYDGNGNRINSIPTKYYFNQSYLQLDNPPNLAYPYAISYYQQPPALSVSNTTNFLTTYYPRMLRAAILAEAVEYTKEVGAGTFDRTYWLSVAQVEMETAQIESDMAKRSASNMTGIVML